MPLTDVKTSVVRLAVVTLLVGLGAGLGGMALALFLHFIQHLAYGYSLDMVVGAESFLQGVSAAPPMRRVVVLLICGVLSGVGWWALYRYGRPLISIKKSVQEPDEPMPQPEAGLSALLQIATVALGSPLGREVAPREIGAAFAGRLSRHAGLSVEEARILIACGAGAGLAAVYNVPLSGALFVLEVLLGTFSLNALLPAIVTSGIAALVAWIGLGDEVQYPVMPFTISTSLVVWSVLAGPLLGLAAHGFKRVSAAISARAPDDWRLVPWNIGVFAGIGLLATGFPQLLGNGRGPLQLSFASDLPLGLAATLLVLRLVVTLAALRAGAKGGLLTPGMTIGALLATVLGALWGLAWPGIPLGVFGLIGAAAFLAASMNMPLTAIALILEFTRVGQDLLFPLIFAVSGSIAVEKLCAATFQPGRQPAVAPGVSH